MHFFTVFGIITLYGGIHMYRQIEEKLSAWKKSSNKKPLIIKGARQVGKTYSIRKFAKENYRQIVEINFERDLILLKVFHKTRNPNDILEYLKVTYMDVNFNEQTLLFMDEIQACPDAITSLKFMKETFPCDIICSGSMLGIAIAKSTSFPVGYVETWEMCPMGFIEFLKALNIPQETITRIQSSNESLHEIPEVLHDKMNELFTSYMVVGGMPEVVLTYAETKSYKDSLEVQRRIVSDYMNDMVKYAGSSDKIKARECFSSIPVQLAKEHKKFQYKVVKKGYNARYFDSSLRWLEDSGMILKVNRIAIISTPLKAQIELAIFKIYMNDTGLFISQLEDGDIRKIIVDDLGIYKGVLYENITAQIFKQYQKSCYYYEPSQESEIDFLIEFEGELTPIEVKSSKHTRSKSFNNYVAKYQPKKAFRFSSKNVGISTDGSQVYVPLYLLETILYNEKEIVE